MKRARHGDEDVAHGCEGGGVAGQEGRVEACGIEEGRGKVRDANQADATATPTETWESQEARAKRELRTASPKGSPQILLVRLQADPHACDGRWKRAMADGAAVPCNAPTFDGRFLT